MPTTEMPSDDATDGVLTTAACDAHAAVDALPGSGKNTFGAVVFGPQHRFPSRSRGRPSNYAAAHSKMSKTPPKSGGKGSTVPKSKKKSSKTIVGKDPTPSKSKERVQPAVSVLVNGVSPLLVAGLAKVRAGKLKVEKEKRQKAKIEEEKKQKGNSSQSKSPKVPSQSKRKTATLPVTSSNSKNDASSVIKKRGIRRRSRRKRREKGRRGVTSLLMMI